MIDLFEYVDQKLKYIALNPIENPAYILMNEYSKRTSAVTRQDFLIIDVSSFG